MKLFKTTDTHTIASLHRKCFVSRYTAWSDCSFYWDILL